MDRHYLFGTIDFDSAQSVFEFLDRCKGNAELLICSDGGTVGPALAIIGAMSKFKKVLTVIAYGQCDSAATIILACAPNRKMHKEAWFMVHDDDLSKDGSDKEIKANIKQLARENAQWDAILAAHSNITEDLWRKLSSKITYMNAEECLQIGVIDEIID
jgi:ATP-dependent protease ClpP protease subunit